MSWYDSRTEKPNSNHFDTYFVVFFIAGISMLGLADWMPKDNYTDGDWQNIRATNGNPLSGEVLYWMPHPTKPELA